MNWKIFTEGQNKANRYRKHLKKSVSKFIHHEKTPVVVFRKQRKIGSIYVEGNIRVMITAKNKSIITNRKHSYFIYEFIVLKGSKSPKFRIIPKREE